MKNPSLGDLKVWLMGLTWPGIGRPVLMVTTQSTIFYQADPFISQI